MLRKNYKKQRRKINEGETKNYEIYKCKNKLNKIKLMQIAETLAAVYIYIYIQRGCQLVNKINVKYAENIKFNMNLKKYKRQNYVQKQVTQVYLLYLFKKSAKRTGFLQFLANRDGPKMFLNKTL